MDTLSNPFVWVGAVVVIVLIAIVVMIVLEKKKKREVEELDHRFPEGNLSGENLEKIPVEKVRRTTLERQRRNEKWMEQASKLRRPSEDDQVLPYEDEEFVQIDPQETFSRKGRRERSGFTQRRKTEQESQTPPRFQQQKTRKQAQEDTKSQTQTRLNKGRPFEGQQKKRMGDTLGRFGKLKPSAGVQQEAEENIAASKEFAGMDELVSSMKNGFSQQTIKQKKTLSRNVGEEQNEGSAARRKFKKSVLSSEEGEVASTTETRSNLYRRKTKSTNTTNEDTMDDPQQGATNPYLRRSSKVNQQQTQSSRVKSRRSTTVKRKKMF